MPRYHFNIRQGSNVIPDLEGEDLPDLKAAEFEARMSARELLLQAIAADREIDGRIIEIADDSGKVVASIKVRDVMRLEPVSSGDVMH